MAVVPRIWAMLSEKWADKTIFFKMRQFVYSLRNTIVQLIEIEIMHGVI